MPKRLAALLLALVAARLAPAAETSGPSASDQDPHYTRAGFFDLHVCNWPDRPLFFMMVFSTEHFARIESVAVYDPQARRVGGMDLDRYRIVQRPGRPPKRVFITQVPIGAAAVDGWYTARIRIRDGEEVTARDFVVLDRMARARPASIPDGAELDAVPEALSWTPVPGAAYYQVFVRDLWGDGELLLPAELHETPRVDFPQGLLEPGGTYTWQVHARDVDGHPLLGDFNHGSLSRVYSFSIAEP